MNGSRSEHGDRVSISAKCFQMIAFTSVVSFALVAREDATVTVWEGTHRMFPK